MRTRHGHRAAVVIVAGHVLAACEPDPMGAGQDSFQFCEVIEYALGATVSAHLDATACPLIYRGLQYGEFVHYYTLEVGAARTITIRMSSDEIDPRLIVWHRSTGEIVAEDDDGGPGLNARILRSFEAGRYIIGGSSFAAGETGAYTLTSE
jgi:hypothetical protein